jgi:hypothetical protein
MLQPDEQVTLTLTGGVLQILFNALQEAPMPRRVSDAAIEMLRFQVLIHDPTAFDPPPRINGVLPSVEAPH